MKKVAVVIIGLILLQAGVVSGQEDNRNIQVSKAAVTVAADPEVAELAELWIRAYLGSNTGKEVTLLPAGESGNADLRLFAATPADKEAMKNEWRVVVARDILVPVMSSDNPLFDNVQSVGLDPASLGMLMTSSGRMTWGSLLHNDNNATVTVRIPADDAALKALARFSGVEPGLITAQRLPSGGDISTFLRSNPETILFCRLASITGGNGARITEGINIIPIDVNANGHSDYFEQFYGDYNSFSRGVYIGKYPKELCSSIFCAAATKPSAGAQADFVLWLLAGGQELIAEAGLTALPGGEGMVRREMLAPEMVLVSAGDNRRAGAGGWIWIAAVMAAVSLIAFALYRITKSRAPEGSLKEVFSPVRSFSPETVAAPAGILFGKSHTWTFMEKNGTLTLGIDDFLQHVTGTISRISLKSPGEKVRRGDRLASVIQRGKQLDIISPVSGTIISRNEKLASDTGILHASPYADGWIYGIEPENWLNESRLMLTASKYTAQIREEFGRIRDFLATFTGANEVRLAHVVLQDGGELSEGLLEQFGPEVWEEFQAKFLN